MGDPVPSIEFLGSLGHPVGEPDTVLDLVFRMHAKGRANERAWRLVNSRVMVAGLALALCRPGDRAALKVALVGTGVCDGELLREMRFENLGPAPCQ